MKKFINKQTISAFIIGALITGCIPAYAAVQEYILTSTASKITVDGAEVKNDQLPMMSYQGYNYIPAATFRDICDKIGVGFEWNNEAKEIQITTSTGTTTTGAIDLSDKITQTPDGLPVFQYKGSNYIEWLELRKKCESLGLHFRIENNAFNFKNSDDTLICSIELFTIYSPFDYAKYDDYINIVLPLIK
jgi:hypothetical protein